LLFLCYFGRRLKATTIKPQKQPKSRMKLYFALRKKLRLFVGKRTIDEIP